MSLFLARISNSLPAAFDVLRSEAEAEGYHHMNRLAAEHAENPKMFQAIFAAYAGGKLAGIGAITGLFNALYIAVAQGGESRWPHTAKM